MRVASRMPRPARRKDQIVSAAPPTPPVGSRRVAAAPPSETSALSRSPSRRVVRRPTSHSSATYPTKDSSSKAAAAPTHSGIRVERSTQRVGEGLQRAPCRHQRHSRHDRECGGQRGTARQRAKVEGRKPQSRLFVPVVEGGERHACSLPVEPFQNIGGVP